VSWRIRFNAKGSFRGVPFVCPSDEMTGGNRAQQHEYPLRDIGWVEILGKKTKSYNLDLFVAGDNYDKTRDKLIEALDKPEPGILAHPRFGRLNVVVIDFRKTESTREGGMCRFSVTFVDAGAATFPRAGDDTAAVVDAAANQSLADAINSFAEAFSVLGQAADYVNGVVDEISRTLQAVENVTDAITSPIADLIRAPADMAATIVGSMHRISTLVNTPLQALNIYQSLFNAGASSPSIPLTTTNRQRQAANVEQLHLLVRRVAIAEAAMLASATGFASSNDALHWRDAIGQAIDDQLDYVDQINGLPIDDAVYLSLTALRAAVTADLSDRVAQLPRVITHTPLQSQPTLVIAHQLYGDASRDDEIVNRNNIRHPLFVAGGESLEVLSE